MSSSKVIGIILTDIYNVGRVTDNTSLGYSSV